MSRSLRLCTGVPFETSPGRYVKTAVLGRVIESGHILEGQLGRACIGPLPPRHDHLLACIKIHPISTLQMQIAVKRPFPSREWEEGKRLRDADIDSHDSRFDPFTKLVCGATRTGKDNCHITIVDLV